MIIDIHAHPVLLDVINEDPEDLSFRKQQFGVFKSGRNPILLFRSVVFSYSRGPGSFPGCGLFKPF